MRVNIFLLVVAVLATVGVVLYPGECKGMPGEINVENSRPWVAQPEVPAVVTEFLTADSPDIEAFDVMNGIERYTFVLLDDATSCWLFVNGQKYKMEEFHLTVYGDFWDMPIFEGVNSIRVSKAGSRCGTPDYSCEYDLRMDFRKEFAGGGDLGMANMTLCVVARHENVQVFKVCDEDVQFFESVVNTNRPDPCPDGTEWSWQHYQCVPK